MDSRTVGQISLLKTKLRDTASEIKGIVEQGRLIAKDESHLFLFKGMFRELKPYFDAFNETWQKLLELHSPAEAQATFPTDSDKNLQTAAKRYYYEACAIYESHMNPTPVAAASAQHSAFNEGGSSTLNESRSVRARLPQINLPEFSGNQGEWPLFRDTYISLIHLEPSLSKIEKFHFLVSCLKGPALSLIRSVPLMDSNYEQAWRILKENYDDKRRLAGSYLKAILNYAPFKNRPTASGLKHFITAVLESVTAFKQLELENPEDFILSYLVLRCLDPATRKDYEKEVANLESPPFESLVTFIKNEWKTLDLTTDDSKNPPFSVSSPNKSKDSSGSYSRGKPGFWSRKPDVSLFVDGERFSSVHRSYARKQATKDSASLQRSCPVCKAQHTLYNCTTFRNASPGVKRKQLKGWNGCLNCLSSKHKVDACNSTRTCQHCREKHHSWLHIVSAEDHSTQGSGAQSAALGATSRFGTVILGTAIARMLDGRGCYQAVRIVTDPGSQFTFVTARCAARLGLELHKSPPPIVGIGKIPVPKNMILGSVSCTLRPRCSTEAFSTEAVLVTDITNNLPQSRLPVEMHQHFGAFELADPTYWKPQEVEVLIGGDVYYDLITGPPISFGEALPKLVPSKLGHIVAGPYNNQTTREDHGLSFMVQTRPEIAEVMHRFWEIEELPKKSFLSEEELACEEHFRSTHYRLPEGRFVVALPFKTSIDRLQNPRSQVFRRFFNLETKLSRRPEFKEEYVKFMEEYLELHHMQRAEAESKYLIPHHAVSKTENGKTKIRVVFDASCEGRSGSLNDHLMVGPKLQRDICDIVIGFRLYPVVLVADIVKMYRQILVRPEDRPYQHILWRSDPKKELLTMELNTVTYGVNSSAFLAIRTLHQLVEEEGHRYPHAAKVVKQCSYMDDFVTGAHSLEEAVLLQEELVNLLRLGGFELGKWKSNNPRLIPDNEEGTELSLSGNNDGGCKILGLKWYAFSDSFTFEVEKPTAPLTKRGILSTIARIFDPLGFLAPVVFKAKTLLQDVWHAKCDWDERIPAQLQTAWSSFAAELPTLVNVKIPRYIRLPTPSPAFDLIGFSDASQRGYAAVLFLRVSRSVTTHSYLLKAKSKLAPRKLMSIPRLELCGALLLARLLDSCRSPLEDLTITNVHLFTDSTIVLGWLNLPLSQLKSFVAHRVASILEITEKRTWHYVSSPLNPADCVSRGLMPNEISNHSLWWSGPTWLQEPPESWPLKVIDYSLATLPETKPTPLISLLAMEWPSILQWMENISSYNRLLRSLSIALRFIKRLRNQPVSKGSISLREIEEARITCIKLIQEDYLSSQENIKSLKSWLSLLPFKDSRGVFRVGGRLEHSKLSFSAKHPIILPDYHFTRILVDFYHRANLHVGPNTLRGILQNRYYLISARKIVRSQVRRCVICQISNPRPKAPIMGNLPSCRLEEGQIFQHVGVDLGGPFPIRESLRRKAALSKSYLCLFICMVTKAVHLEVVTSCSTESFIAALHRFISRRGKPQHIYSDCGTNFVGAAAEFKKFVAWYKAENAQAQFHDFSAQNEIQWHFNPPHSPHFGGIWEAGIKSAKSLLSKNLGNTPLTYEELATLFCRIEAVMNSRPLCPLDDDTSSIDCLTPGHFLIGRAITALPEESLMDIKESRLRRWQLIQQRVQHFWSRWKSSYLNELQQRR